MHTVRVNISLPEELLKEISREIGPRRRSRFITQAIERSLRELKDQKLAAEYEEAAAEISRINQDLEGAMADGLD